MTPEQLRPLLEEVVAHAARAGELPDEAEAGPPAGPIFRPADTRGGRSRGRLGDAGRAALGPELDLEPLDLARVLAQGLTSSIRSPPSRWRPGPLALTLADSARVRDHPLVVEDQAPTPCRR